MEEQKEPVSQKKTVGALSGRWQRLKLNQKFTVIIALFVTVPVILFSMYLFHGMEENVVREKENSVEYSMNQQHNLIQKNVDSINMSTQFFLTDNSLLQFLAQAKRGETPDTEGLREFYTRDIAALERMVNNNPYLYQIRVYAACNTVQEMMPILYRQERMKRLSWAQEEDVSGWQYDYTDKLFDSFVLNQSKKIVSLVTPIEDFENGRIGTLEVAMEMETMFPELYRNLTGQFCCFVDDDGNQYYGQQMSEAQKVLVGRLLEKQSQPEQEEIVVFSENMDKTPVVAALLPVKELSGTLVGIYDISAEIGRIHALRNRFILIMAVLFALLLWLVNHVVKSLLRQFYRIIQAVRQVQGGNLYVQIEDCGRDEMGELGSQINTMLVRIRQLMEDNLNRELLAKNSEIKALQNQINAHFIYNVLESVKMMAEIDEEYEISDALTTFGELLRYSMKWNGGNVTVAQEIDYIRNYLALINLRFDYEIYLSLNLPEQLLMQEIPKMSLQPIVENAIYHGIEQLAEDTNIYIKGRVEDGCCIIEISDAGRGMSGEQLESLRRKIAGEIETSGGSGNGIGLKNVQDRLRMNFGEAYGIVIDSREGCYTRVQVRIPWKEKGGERTV